MFATASRNGSRSFSKLIIWSGLVARAPFVTFNRRQRVRGAAETDVPDNERFRRVLPQPFRQMRLLDVNLPRFLHRIRPRMHDLAGGNLANARETFPRFVHLVITEAIWRVHLSFQNVTCFS